MCRILVIGGSGFIGREICRVGVDNDHDVRSVSRSGRPESSEPWVDGGDWHRADIFAPNTWRDKLDGCDAVVHTVGIISMTPTKGVRRERLDGDSAIIAALEAERAAVPSFVLLSVMGALATDAHLGAKRRAERTATALDLRTTTLRLGPVYDDEAESPYPRPLNPVLRRIDERDWLARRCGGARPRSVTTVATAAIRAALDADTPSIVEVDEIEVYSTANSAIGPVASPN